jgi:hypothetical protein
MLGRALVGVAPGCGGIKISVRAKIKCILIVIFVVMLTPNTTADIPSFVFVVVGELRSLVAIGAMRAIATVPPTRH